MDAIEIYLAPEGYNILKAYDGIQAVEMIRTHEVHLLILDVMMPRMDGLRGNVKNPGTVQYTDHYPVGQDRGYR